MSEVPVQNKPLEHPHDCLAVAQALTGHAMLDEAEALLTDALARFPYDPGLAIQYALLAQEKRDWQAALDRWRAVRMRHPVTLEAYLREAQVLRRLRCFKEAMDVLEVGAGYFPDSAELACERGWTAVAENRLTEADALFRVARLRFPEAPEGYVGGARALRIQGRLPEAGQLLEQAMQRLPNDPGIHIEHARLPLANSRQHKPDFDEAARRFAILRVRFPNVAVGYASGIASLRNAGRRDEADALASQAMQHFPGNPEIAAQYARTAAQASDHLEAIRRFASMTERFPNHVGGYVGFAAALGSAGQDDAAEDFVKLLTQRFPSHFAIACAYAEAAARRQDWPEALRRWARVRERFPHEDQVLRAIFETQLHIAETDPDAMSCAVAPAAKTIRPQQMSDFLLRFESLGGTVVGCEFGLLQRHFGVEPLGLLRWAEIGPNQLTAALQVRFAGVGDPENTRLSVSRSSPDPEYGTEDRRFGMRMHTFVKAREIPHDRMFDQVCRRLRFLRGKLVADLEAGEKIFVHKATRRSLTDDEIDGLHRAMSKFGNNVLLCVRYEDAGHPNGTVDLVRPGLLVGYIDRFQISPDGVRGAPNSIAWSTICTKALALREAALSGG